MILYGMKHGDQSIALVNELHKTIDYFREEFEVDYAQVVGSIEIVKSDILEELHEIER